MPSAWPVTLLEAAYRRGWLARPAHGKAAWLVEQGLHPEQVLLGTGLLTMERYAELVSACFGRSLVRLDRDAWTLAAFDGPLPEAAAFAEHEDGSRALLVSDVWDPAVHSALPTGLPVVPVFRSDLLAWRRRPDPVDLSVSAWWEAFVKEGETEIRLGLDQGVGRAWSGADGREAPSLAVTREELPAIQAWLEAGFPSRDWEAHRLPGVESDMLELVSVHDAHPLAKAEPWQAFLRRPVGVLVCLAPDAWLERRLSHLPEVADHSALFAATAPVRVRPQDEGAREAAWQAALAGCPLCWIEETAEDLAWIRRLAGAGVPATVVRRRSTPHGSAWEAYRISV